MATKQENRRTDVIRCQYCGEDYSVTYKRCPFCDDKAGNGGYSGGDGTVSGKGGRRVATNTRGGGYGGRMQPLQLIGLLLSLVLIAAAVAIVFSVLKPLFGGGEASGSESQAISSSAQSDVSVSQPASSISQPAISDTVPDVSTPGDVSAPVVPNPSGSDVVTPVVAATGITLSAEDITLNADESSKLKATVAPVGCTDTVVWTSSKESVLKVMQDGTVINMNTGNIQETVTVTAQVGTVKDSCLVRCKPGSTGKPASGSESAPVPSGTGTIKPGSTGTVTGTSTGLLIRSGPGKNYEAQDTATNGTVVTILEQTADGWLKISYAGDGGKTKNGYVSKDYIKVN